MEFLVRVAGSADERDLWPYARNVSGEAESPLLLLTVHDTQELVGALARLSAIGLKLISVQRRGQSSAFAEGPGAADDPYCAVGEAG